MQARGRRLEDGRKQTSMASLRSLNPATGELIAEVRAASKVDDYEAVVTDAREVFQSMANGARPASR